jgi:hypothetical protein
MSRHIREWAGAILTGSAIALASLIIANYFFVPGKPAAGVVAVGGLAGLAGALWMFSINKKSLDAAGDPEAPKPANSGLPWQVNRLFIFNTLHNAAALTLVDPEKARTVIERFADYLRVVHEVNQHPATLLNLEVRCAEMFLSIERARFGDRLQVIEDVAPDCLEVSVPSLALQPLVAYAVRDGVETTDMTVRVTLKVWRNEHEVLLEVRQDCPGEPDPRRRERLQIDLGFPELTRLLLLESGRGARIEIERLEPQGTSLRIRLPQRANPARNNSAFEACGT